MHEQIRITFMSQGQPLPLEFAERGVIVNRESAAAPRRLLFEFDGFGASTKARMRFIQERENWHPHIFPLVIGSDQGTLIVRGLEPDTLPPGLYKCRIVIDDLKLPDRGRFGIEVHEDRGADVVLAAEQDGRQVRLTREADALPPVIRRLLTDPASRLDGDGALAWMDSMTVRGSRKACLLNVLAKIASVPEPLADAVHSIYFADVDRIYTRATAACATLMRRLAADRKQPFFFEGSPKAPVHLRMLDRAGVARDVYDLESYRQQGRNSLQVVVGVPRRAGDPHLAEFDIDLGNPLQDVVGFIVHLGEVANPGKTDHFALRAKLLRSPARDFICYDIVEPHVDVRVVGV